MDSKTKHRILGVLVVIGLVIIILPFLQSGSELSAEATTVKTPPFPDQSIQVTSSPLTQQPAPPTISNPIIDNKPVSTSIAKPQQQEEKEVPPQQTSSVSNSISSTVMEAEKTREESGSQTVRVEKSAFSEKKLSEDVSLDDEKKTFPSKKVIHTKAKHLTRIKVRMPIINDNGLFKLEQAAWVVQVGSFKTKAHALRVVNTLRANGYRAFIQQMSPTPDENTRVFVGPENQQTRARDLAEKLENDMHLRGIVISYKPLAT